MSRRSFPLVSALRGGAFGLGATLVLAALVASCGDEEPPINRVGVNVVEKSVFQGSWYMARTVIDVDYEGSELGTFPGDAASDAAQSFTALPRIRWLIDKDVLFAYRDYELSPGGDGEHKGPAPESERPGVTEPVAAFEIEKHFDIRRDFNPATGEELNVIVENDTDKRWFEREFMRVDWSKNLLPGFYGQTYNLNELVGIWKREPADLYVQEQSVFPDSWKPRFDRMACDGSGDESEACQEGERDLADDYGKDELYHMSFVTQEVLSPGLVPEVDSQTGFQTGRQANWCVQKIYSDSPVCSSIASYVRTSFLKVSDERQYEPVNWTDQRFERFGYFRLGQDVIDRSTGSPSDPAYFQTDFVNYNINRHNLWKQWHDAKGKPIPYGDRDVRQIVWYTTPELPAHLVRPTFDVVGQWNEVFMGTIRELRGEPAAKYADVECQSDDPDAYCFCQEDATGKVIQPTCPGRYDPFTPPDAYEGAEDPYDCYVDVPDGAEPDMEENDAVSDADFNGWYDAKFVGSECATILRVNTCNRASIAKNEGTTEGLDCQDRGDLRYKFLSYVDQPGTGFLGIATLRGDPITGEILTGDANIGGPALDSFRTSALLGYDLVHGTLDERDIIAGEDVRSYFENLGRVDLPARPRTDFTVATAAGKAPSADARAEIDGVMENAMARISRLQGPEGRNNVFSDRRQKLVGTALERRLLSGPDALAAAGVDVLPANGQLSDAQLAQASPFRNDASRTLHAAQQLENKLSRANVEMPNEYVDDSVRWFVNKHLDWSRARLEFGVNRLLYRQTELHELGHCFGLRHDFGGTVDSEHYAPEYYAITERLPLPDPDDFDTDGTAGLSATEQLALDREYEKVRKQRELAGIDGAMSSSVMDYTANWYQRIQPLGRYDKAAIAFGYGDLVEAYAGPAAADTERRMLLGYQGGEVCETDADCPYSASGERARLLHANNMDAGLTQRCVQNPRVADAKLCTSLDQDMAAQVEAGEAELNPLSYRFCTDDRADSTLAWCNRFDEGASYREIVRNVEEDYERAYPFAAFRRYRKGFSISSYRDGLLGRRLGVLQNIYQNLLFQYSSDPSFRQKTGAFGFYDQFLATTDILNFYGKILATPNVGGYVFDPRERTFVRGFLSPDATNADLKVPLGLGRYFNSDYQAGLSGIERIERVGSFFDKVWVLQLMTSRGGQPDYTRDVAFYANFYDLFPNEMQQIWNGMIRGFPSAYMPRIVCDSGQPPACQNPRVVYMDFYRGDCSKQETCRPNPAEVTYAGLPVLDGGGSLSLQIYAAAFGLQDFPVFFDTSFQNQLLVCIEGQGDCFEPDPAADQGVDFVRYTSPRYRRSFLAFQVDPALGVGEQTSIGFAMVKEARELDTVLTVLVKLVNTDPPYDTAQLTAEDLAALDELGYTLPDNAMAIDNEIDRINVRIIDLESFFNQLIELQRDFGIQSFRYWR